MIFEILDFLVADTLSYYVWRTTKGLNAFKDLVASNATACYDTVFDIYQGYIYLVVDPENWLINV